jgi:hypothetical protein
VLAPTVHEEERPAAADGLYATDDLELGLSIWLRRI